MERPRWLQTISVGNSALLFLTFFAQYGNGHSEVHYDLAKLAMLTEAGTAIAAGLGDGLRGKHPRLSRSMSRLAAVGIIATSGFFAGFINTDVRYRNYYEGGRSVTDVNDFVGFMGILKEDFYRHLSDSRIKFEEDLNLVLGINSNH